MSTTRVQVDRDRGNFAALRAVNGFRGYWDVWFRTSLVIGALICAGLQTSCSESKPGRAPTEPVDAIGPDAIPTDVSGTDTTPDTAPDTVPDTVPDTTPEPDIVEPPVEGAAAAQGRRRHP